LVIYKKISDENKGRLLGECQLFLYNRAHLDSAPHGVHVAILSLSSIFVFIFIFVFYPFLSLAPFPILLGNRKTGIEDLNLELTKSGKE